MTDQEFETVALAIKAAYPNSNVLPDKYTMKVWYRALMDIDFFVVENAVWEHISTSIFPPSIAEIREKCAARLSPMVTDWGEAWEEVQRAIQKYGRYQEEEALSSMNRMTKAAVRRMGFQNLCNSENLVADRAHFQRMYEEMVKEEKRQTQLPEFVQNERTRIIESHTLPILKIEGKENQVPESVERADPGHISKLLEKLYQSMGTGKRA
ncbi:MAG: hypothetical protein HFG39_07640 [Lachnospiraceae bacterium]|nr:hypothetical protein [Lachnospiraceae bacterium]